MAVCKCGCGREIIIKSYHKYYGIPEYIRGHNTRGKSISLEHKQKFSRHGLKNSKEHNQKISDSLTGIRNYNYGKLGKESSNWKGGLTSLQDLIRKSDKFKFHQEIILKRDLYICQYCGQRGGELHSHHIKSVNNIIKENNLTTLEMAFKCEDLWNLTNGITYCKKCHNLLKNKGGLL